MVAITRHGRQQHEKCDNHQTDGDPAAEPKWPRRSRQPDAAGQCHQQPKEIQDLAGCGFGRMQPARVFPRHQRPGHDQCRDGAKQDAAKNIAPIALRGREMFQRMLLFATARQGTTPEQCDPPAEMLSCRQRRRKCVRGSALIPPIPSHLPQYAFASRCSLAESASDSTNTAAWPGSAAYKRFEPPSVLPRCRTCFTPPVVCASITCLGLPSP